MSPCVLSPHKDRHEQTVDLASDENKIVKRLRHLALRKLAEDAARLDARRARRMSPCKLREKAENVDDQLRRDRRAAANEGVQLILECSALAFGVDENVAGGSTRRGRGARASAEWRACLPPILTKGDGPKPCSGRKGQRLPRRGEEQTTQQPRHPCAAMAAANRGSAAGSKDCLLACI